MSNTIVQSLAALATAKSSIATAITNKGGTVNTGDGFSDFAAKIGTIPAGKTVEVGTFTPSFDIASATTALTDIEGFCAFLIDKTASVGSGNIWNDGYYTVQSVFYNSNVSSNDVHVQEVRAMGTSSHLERSTIANFNGMYPTFRSRLSGTTLVFCECITDTCFIPGTWAYVIWGS